MTAKVCTKCKEPKPRTEFYGRLSRCTSCHNAITTAYHSRRRQDPVLAARDRARSRELYHQRKAKRLRQQPTVPRLGAKHCAAKVAGRITCYGVVFRAGLCRAHYYQARKNAA